MSVSYFDRNIVLNLQEYATILSRIQNTEYGSMQISTL